MILAQRANERDNERLKVFLRNRLQATKSCKDSAGYAGVSERSMLQLDVIRHHFGSHSRIEQIRLLDTQRKQQLDMLQHVM